MSCPFRSVVTTLLAFAVLASWTSPSHARQDAPAEQTQDPGDGLTADGEGMDLPKGKGTPKKKGARVRKGATKGMKGKGAAKGQTPPAEADAAKTAVAAADGPKFSRDVAPVLSRLCIGCHEPNRLRGKLDVTTFEKLLKGTPDEPVIVPGKPEESHLLLRIKGEETPRMPQNGQQGVSEAAIEKIEQWIKAGALLDKGLDPKALISSYALSADDIKKQELAKLPPDQRDQKTIEVGLARWKKANAKLVPEVTPGKRFILFSTLPKDRAANALKTLETQYSALGAWFGPEAIESTEKLSVYVFNDSGSYGEFVRNVEQREVESSDTGSSKLNTTEPYLALIDPSGGREEPKGAATKKGAKGKRRGSENDGPERSLAGVLTEQLAIGTVSKAGKSPRWVTLGVATYLGSKVEPRSPFYNSLRTEAHDLMDQGWASKANDALGDATKVEVVRAVGFAIIEWLASVDKDLAVEFAKGMLKGQEKLDEVIGNVLSGNREDFLAGSANFIEANYPASR